MDRTCFDIVSELLARDIDSDLIRRAKAKTPTERIEWLEEMQSFAAEMKAAAAAKRVGNK